MLSGTSMRWTATEILQILDECCDNFTFPMLDNGYVYPAATRLSLYRTPEDWAMVIEVFGYVRSPVIVDRLK
jgi:hypothetical protein